MSRVTYQEAETYISELPKFTKKNTLEHTQKFLSFLGNPQNGKKVIHVAGTNASGWMENRFQTRHLPVCFYGHNRA